MLIVMKGSINDLATNSNNGNNRPVYKINEFVGVTDIDVTPLVPLVPAPSHFEV
jgi:hypothetical protein